MSKAGSGPESWNMTSPKTLVAIGAGGRMLAQGMVHDGVELALGGARQRIDLKGLSGGKTITVYGQHEVVRDLIDLRLAEGLPLHFDARDVAIQDLAGDRPSVTWRDADGTDHRITGHYLAGCDGFHGTCRKAIPQDALTVYRRDYPFGWLGILAQAAPIQHELIYARHADGFALFSMRSETVTRLYLQCAPDEDVAQWSDDRIWHALTARPGTGVNQGPILDRSVTAMRSFVATPMRWGRLFLAGDAAHIVPPTGAKGLNLAVSDVRVLAECLDQALNGGRADALDAYSDRCLQRIWKVQRFSWWMTRLFHKFEDGDAVADRIRAAELGYVLSSEAAQTTLAENYVGLPLSPRPGGTKAEPSGSNGGLAMIVAGRIRPRISIRMPGSDPRPSRSGRSGRAAPSAPDCWIRWPPTPLKCRRPAPRTAAG